MMVETTGWEPQCMFWKDPASLQQWSQHTPGHPALEEPPVGCDISPPTPRSLLPLSLKLREAARLLGRTSRCLIIEVWDEFPNLSFSPSVA